jgi:nucleoside-triphosphatase
VASGLPQARLGGFITEEIRLRGERRGFALVTFDGRRSTLAHVERAGPPRVGKYGVAVDTLDALARSALTVRPSVTLYLVDEIGKMECLSSTFVDATRALLDERVPLVATVGQRGGGFIAEVKRRRDVTLWEVTSANRDAMPARVREWIERAR